MVRKVCIVVTARPSYSRIRTVMQAVAEHPHLELQVIAAASALLPRYGRVVDQMEQDGFQIAERVYMIIEGETPTSMAKSTGLGVLELATALDNLKPDIVVTVADRHETLATALAASYMNIPLAHVQGGEVTGSIDEKVRHAVTKLADIHFVATDLAGERVRRMGEEPRAVHVTGCPSIDVAAKAHPRKQLSFDPVAKYGGVGDSVCFNDPYLIVMQHPVTTEFEDARYQIEETLHAVADSGFQAAWFWPNVDAGSDGTSAGIRAFRERHDAKGIRFFKNLSPDDFLELLVNCSAIVGNSSVAIREAAYLGVPAVNIGSRQRGRERGRNVVDVSGDRRSIEAAIQERVAGGHFPPDPLYGDGRAGERIADLLSTCELTIEKRLSY